MLERLTTEARNPRSTDIDQLSALEIVHLMNGEDATIAAAIAKESAQIAKAIELISQRIRLGGRLVYLGAGTSGRLGVLDAAECPPTFNTKPELVVGIIAGGHTALTRAVEGAEDQRENANEDLRSVQFSNKDVLVGIASSGRTPYVLAGLRFARESGGATIGLSCNEHSDLVEESDIAILPVVGPEVISGSTRLKAGTATKMVLNMLTTGTMVLLGKTFGNLMVDLRATNTKLRERACRIVMSLTNSTREVALALLDECQGELKTAVVSHQHGISAEEARQLLASVDGHLRRALLAPCPPLSTKRSGPH